MTNETREPVTLAELEELREWVEENLPRLRDYVLIDFYDRDMIRYNAHLATLDKLIAAHTENREGEKRG